MSNAIVGQFNISWHNGAYYVDIPQYNGGDVMPAQVAHDMLEALKPFSKLLDVVEHMGGPTITETVCEFESHVAGVGRLTMSDLRAARAAIAKATGG